MEHNTPPDKDPDDPKELFKQIMPSFGDSFLLMLIGFAIGWLTVGAVNLLSKALGVGALSETLTGSLSMAPVIAVVLTNPLQHYRSGRPWIGYLVRFLLVFAAGFSFLYFSPGHFEAMAKGEDSTWTWVFYGLGMIAMMAVFFLVPNATKRFESQSDLPLTARLRSAAFEMLDTCGPALMIMSLGISAGLFFLVAPSLPVTFGVLSILIVAITAETAFGDGQVPEEDAVIERSQTLKDFWPKLWGFLRDGLPSHAFIGGLVYLTLFPLRTLDFDLDMFATAPWTALGTLLFLILAPLIILPAGMLFGSLTSAGLLTLIAQWQRWDLFTLEQKAEKLSGMFFGGGLMHLFHAGLKDDESDKTEGK